MSEAELVALNGLCIATLMATSMCFAVRLAHKLAAMAYNLRTPLFDVGDEGEHDDDTAGRVDRGDSPSASRP